MIDESNPAGRLYKILMAARKYQDDTKIRKVWSETLNCSESDDAEISLRVIEVYQLSHEVQRLIKLIPELNHDLYLESFSKIDSAIFPLNLQSRWGDKKKSLGEGLMTSLKFCAEELGKHYSEESISDDDLKEVTQMVTELFDVVSSSDIDPTLRMALLEEIERIRSAIAVYRIRGARGVKEALQSLLGAVIVNREGLAELSDDRPGITTKLGELIDKLDSFTSRALKVGRVLSGPIAKALEFLKESGVS